MAVKIVTGKNLPIGVDLGTSSVKLAQLRESDSGHELLAAGMAEIPTRCGETWRPAWNSAPRRSARCWALTASVAARPS